MTITNFELVALAKQYNVSLKLKDILMVEDLPYRKCVESMNLILNFQVKGTEVSHFVCLVVRDTDAFYMDSFGSYPVKEVVDYCKSNGLKLGYNGRVVQDMKSTNCGVYCFAFLLYLKNGGELFETANKFLNLFQKKVEKNDDILHNILAKLEVKHDYK